MVLAREWGSGEVGAELKKIHPLPPGARPGTAPPKLNNHVVTIRPDNVQLPTHPTPTQRYTTNEKKLTTTNLHEILKKMKKALVCAVLLLAVVAASAQEAEKKDAVPSLTTKKFLDLLPALRGGSKVELASCSTTGFDNRCATAYQGCCIAYGAKGFPCKCHLTDGNGKAGSECGTCGTAYAACCVGFAARGSPCTCDVENT